jgi:hypothetical protein
LIIRHLQVICGCLFFDRPSSRQVLGERPFSMSIHKIKQPIGKPFKNCLSGENKIHPLLILS